MKHLFKDWEKAGKLIRSSSRVLLLADFDGTLTRIVSRPKDAVLSEGTRSILKELSRDKRYYVGVISGRKLSDVKKRVGLKNIYYAGNHGLEIEGPAFSYLHPSCGKFAECLRELDEKLSAGIRDIKGTILEHKGVSMSLHYRLVAPGRVKDLEAVFKAACAPYIKKGVIKVSGGKKVWEIKLPVKWHKGSAVKKILTFVRKKGNNILPIYLGDDITDEDAFSALKGKRALTVFVGRRRSTAAAYHLRTPDEVRKFLDRLCRL